MPGEFVARNGLISLNDTTITGSFTVVTGSNVELQVTNTGVKLGNLLTDRHTVTGSLGISGSLGIAGTFSTTGSFLVTGSLSTSGSLYITPSQNTEAIVVSGYSLTGSNAQSAIDISGTWNTTGTPSLIKATLTNTNSSTQALLFDLQVGNGTSLGIDKNGLIHWGTYNANGAKVGSSTAAGTVATRGVSLYFRGDARANVGYDIFFNNGTTRNPTSGDNGVIKNTTLFNPITGSAVWNGYLMDLIVNQTGGANGITRGLYVNPTLTAAADWRSIEWSNNTGFGLYGAGTANNYLAGRLLLNTLTDAGFQLDVNGTSRFQNSMVVTGSVTATSFTGSLSGSVTNATTASYVTNLNYSELRGTPLKTFCKAATTGSIQITGSITNMDFVPLNTGDRLLVWNQPTSSENGIYEITGSSLVRARDFSQTTDLVPRLQVTVLSGSLYGDTTFELASVGSGNIGTASLVFTGVEGSTLAQSQVGLEYFNDFYSNVVVDGFIDFSNLTGTAGSQIAGTNITPYGQWQLGATGTPGSAQIGNNNLSFVMPSNEGKIVVETGFRLNQLSVDGLSNRNRYQFYWGFTSNNNSTYTAAANNQIGFLYDESGSTSGATSSLNWQTNTSLGGVRTYTTTNTAVTSTYTRLGIVVESGTASFYTNNTLVAQHTTNLPTGSSNTMGLRWSLISISGSGSNTFAYIDYVRFRYIPTGSRP